MKVVLSVSDIGWEKDYEVNEAHPVHHILYEALHSARQAQVARAEDIYSDLASYGLYAKLVGSTEIQEIPKDQHLKLNQLEGQQKLFVLHRGKKATKERRQNEETYRIQYENRGAGTGKRTRASRIETTTTSVSEPSRPKRTQSLAPTSYKQTKTRRRKGTAMPRQEKGANLDTAQALAQAQEIQKIKKNIEKTRTKREKHVASRRQKLVAGMSMKGMYDSKLVAQFRAHSKSESNYKNDYATPVYCATFLPSLEQEGTLSSIVCVGGGHKLCFLDCEAGKAVKLFQANPVESFYCVAATFLASFRLRQEESADSIIIAAAGKQADIKLIHYGKNECYSVLSGHSGNVNELEFSQKTPHHLLSASSDQTAILWDIQEECALAKFEAGMEINSLSVAVDGSYFVVAGGSYKDKSYGFDLFALRNSSQTGEWTTRPMLRHRLPSTSLVTIDCIRLINHSTLVCKPFPGNEIIGWSFFRQPGAKQLRCVELFRLQHSHSISQSVHKFSLSHDRMELFVGDKDGGFSIFDVPIDAIGESDTFPPKEIGYHPQCVDYSLQIIEGPALDENNETHWVVTTGSMNYVYIWQRGIKQPDQVQEEANEINAIEVMEPLAMSYMPPFPTAGTTDSFQSGAGFGWGAFPTAQDFPNLSSVVIFESDDEDEQPARTESAPVDDDDDEIIVYM